MFPLNMVCVQVRENDAKGINEMKAIFFPLFTFQAAFISGSVSYARRKIRVNIKLSLCFRICVLAIHRRH